MADLSAPSPLAFDPRASRLHAAWSFPGVHQQDSRWGLGLAMLLALLIHGGLSIVQATPSAAAIASGDVSHLETFIPIDEVLPAPQPTQASEAEESDEPQSSPESKGRVANHLPQVPTTTNSGDAHAQAEKPGPSPDQLAAPITTSDFASTNFAMLSGHGTSLRSGGLGRPGRGNGARPTSTTVSARDLSRAAIAPNLKPLVQRNFPTAARLARVGGTVTVSALIQPDGNPTDIRVVSVSPQGRGFGETCSRTVHEGPNWKPKLNEQGTPVASREHYTCRFDPPEGPAPADVDGPTTGVGANRIWTKPAGG